MKKIVIVGGSSGIGRELALLLSERHQVLLLSRNMESLRQTQSEAGSLLSIGQLDLQSENCRQDMDAFLEGDFAEFDILINNAGYLVNKPFSQLNDEDIEGMLSTNLSGLIKSCQVAIPKINTGGHIVNIGSMGGFQGSSKFPGLSVYSASKAAVAALSECLAIELLDQGIACNCLALGAVQTEMLNKAFPDYQAPLSASEMADFIAEFVLTANKWMNGKVIPVALSNPT